MKFNCPICNKAGLPDYRIQETICPQCNSDLKPYMVLHSVIKTKSRKLMIALVSTVALLIVLSGIFIFSLKKRNENIRVSQSSLVAAQDSIKTLRVSLSKNEENKASPPINSKEVILIYKVKSGDYLGKIAQLFYNDHLMYRKIADDNNLQDPFILNVGQSLTIKIQQ
mgnify:CR=1 FL=1